MIEFLHVWILHIFIQKIVFLNALRGWRKIKFTTHSLSIKVQIQFPHLQTKFFPTHLLRSSLIYFIPLTSFYYLIYIVFCTRNSIINWIQKRVLLAIYLNICTQITTTIELHHYDTTLEKFDSIYQNVIEIFFYLCIFLNVKLKIHVVDHMARMLW